MFLFRTSKYPNKLEEKKHYLEYIWDFSESNVMPSNGIKCRNKYKQKLVKLNKKCKSSLTTTHVGAPQGSVLSPILFTLHTNDCKLNTKEVQLIKFADDSTLQGFINGDNDESLYRASIVEFTEWCDNHRLLLNIKKTKELIIDFRKKKTPLIPLEI